MLGLASCLIVSTVGASPSDVLICVGTPFHSQRTVELLRMDISELGYTSSLKNDCVKTEYPSYAETMSAAGV